MTVLVVHSFVRVCPRRHFLSPVAALPKGLCTDQPLVQAPCAALPRTRTMHMQKLAVGHVTSHQKACTGVSVHKFSMLRSSLSAVTDHKQTNKQTKQESNGPLTVVCCLVTEDDSKLFSWYGCSFSNFIIYWFSVFFFFSPLKYHKFNYQNKKKKKNNQQLRKLLVWKNKIVTAH